MAWKVGVGRGRCRKNKQQPYVLEDTKKSTEHVWTWSRSKCLRRVAAAKAPHREGWTQNPRSARALKSRSPSGSDSLRQRLRKRRRRRREEHAGLRHLTGAPGVGSSLPKMASLLQSERVLYLVQGEKKVRAPLSQLYFCRYCSELRSLECVSHEVTGPSRGDYAPGLGGARLSDCSRREVPPGEAGKSCIYLADWPRGPSFSLVCCFICSSIVT